MAGMQELPQELSKPHIYDQLSSHAPCYYCNSQIRIHIYTHTFIFTANSSVKWPACLIPWLMEPEGPISH